MSQLFVSFLGGVAFMVILLALLERRSINKVEARKPQPIFFIDIFGSKEAAIEEMRRVNRLATNQNNIIYVKGVCYEYIESKITHETTNDVWGIKTIVKRHRGE